jgi:hypothetical protein
MARQYEKRIGNEKFRELNAMRFFCEIEKRNQRSQKTGSTRPSGCLQTF